VIINAGDPQKLLDDLRNDLLDVAVVSLPAPVSGLCVMPVGFECAVAAVPSNLDRDDVSPLELLAQRSLLALPRRMNPAFYDALIAALHSGGLSGSLVEVEAVSVEPLLMEVACGVGCALVPESVTLRMRTPGVSFRQLAGDPPVGCRMAAVTAAADVESHVAAFVARLGQPRREGSLLAA
jgi:hypothetical protein